jgi:hypothetical protein
MTRTEAMQWMSAVKWAAAGAGAFNAASSAEQAELWLAEGVSTDELRREGAVMRTMARRVAPIIGLAALRARLATAGILCAVEE